MPRWISAVVLALVVGSGFLAGTIRGAVAPAPVPTPYDASDPPRTASNLTVLYEDFEGTFPGTWSVSDTNATDGEDYWGTSSQRAWAGSRSAWSAAVGEQVVTPALLWTEDFEGAIPGTNWTIGDLNASGGDDYWGAMSYRVFAGSRSMWSAEVGDNSVLGSPNNVARRYDIGMDAYLRRDVNLAGYAYGELSFAYWLEAESNFDQLLVGFLDAGVWTFPWGRTGPTGAWDSGIVKVPGTANAVGFVFRSNETGVREGAYLDDVELVGWKGTPLWTEDFEGTFPGTAWNVGDANSSAGSDYWGATTYRARTGTRSAWAAQVGTHSVLGSPNAVEHVTDVGMDALMTRDVDLAGTEGAYLAYWYWSSLGGETLFVGWDDPVSGWVYWAVHTGYSYGWAYNLFLLPATATAVGFFFESGSSFNYWEGAYVDDVVLWERTPEPNADTHTYDNSIDAWMTHAVDLSAFTEAWFSWAYWITGDVNYEWFEIAYSEDGGLTWSYLIRGGAGWLGVWSFENTTIPLTTTHIGFHFVSDEGDVAEGMYVDEVMVIGVAPDLACNASGDASAGTEGTTSFAFTGIASGGVPPYAWSWDFGDGGTASVQNPSHVYPLAGTFATNLTVTDDVGQTCTANGGAIVVSHAGPLAVTVSPATASVDEGANVVLSAEVLDAFDHNLTGDATIAWSVTPAGCGSLSSASGAATTFAASVGRGGTTCTVTASATFETLQGADSAAVAVIPPDTGGGTPSEDNNLVLIAALVGFVVAVILATVLLTRRRRSKRVEGPRKASPPKDRQGQQR